MRKKGKCIAYASLSDPGELRRKLVKGEWKNFDSDFIRKHPIVVTVIQPEAFRIEAYPTDSGNYALNGDVKSKMCQPFGWIVEYRKNKFKIKPWWDIGFKHHTNSKEEKYFKIEKT